MNKFFVAGSLALGVIAMPLTVSAQTAPSQSESAVTGKYKRNWDKGSKLEAEGFKSLESAQRDLVRYSADVVDAQNKRDGSDARATNAENEFRRLTSDPIYFASASEAAAWAKRVEDTASTWAKFAGRGADGRDDLSKAIKKQNNAQGAVSDAQAKIDRGRTMMAEAQRLSAAPGRN